MAAGADVIYQATFFDGTLARPRRLPPARRDAGAASRLGPVALRGRRHQARARHVKASAVLQICSYVDQLERIQGVRPEWMHVALGGSARAVERLRVDDYMAYYRERPRPLPGDARRTSRAAPTRPRRPTPSRSSTATSAAGTAECAARRRERRPPEPRGRASAARQRRALTRRGDRHARGARRRCRCRSTRRSTARGDGSARRASTSRPASSSRADARSAPAVRAARCPSRGEPTRARARPRLAAAAVAGRPVLRHRGRPVRARRRARLPLRRPRARRTATVPRHLVARRRRASSRSPARGAPSSGSWTSSWSGSPRPDAAHLPLRAVRADRAQAADGPPRDARGRGRPAAARRRARRPPAGRPPVAARVGRELLDQEAGAASTGSRARSTCATRARASSPSSSGSSSARASGRTATHPRSHRALQPRRRRQQPAAARLARGPRRRAGDADRPGRPAARVRATRRCPEDV